MERFAEALHLPKHLLPLGAFGEVDLAVFDEDGHQANPVEPIQACLHDKEKRAVVAQVGIDGVVVDELSRVVEDGSVLINFYCLEEVGAVAVDDVDPKVDERMGKRAMQGQGLFEHVRPPMNGKNEEVDPFAQGLYLLSKGLNVSNTNE